MHPMRTYCPRLRIDLLLSWASFSWWIGDCEWKKNFIFTVGSTYKLNRKNIYIYRKIESFSFWEPIKPTLLYQTKGHESIVQILVMNQTDLSISCL